MVYEIDGEQMPEEIRPLTGPANYDINLLFVCGKPKELLKSN